MKKQIIGIKPVSGFTFYDGFKTREEIEYYSDRTWAIAYATYYPKDSNLI